MFTVSEVEKRIITLTFKEKLQIFFILLILLNFSSCSFKLGKYSFEGEKYRPYTASNYGSNLELEIITPRFFRDKMDIALTFGEAIMEQKGEINTIYSTSNGGWFGATEARFSKDLIYYNLVVYV